MSYFTANLTPVEEEIRDERTRQNAKWGEQNHPDGTSSIWRQDADEARRDTQQAANEDRVTWLHILREEVAEAMAEDDPAKLRAELIQSAAVIVAWIEAIDRRTASGTPS